MRHPPCLGLFAVLVLGFTASAHGTETAAASAATQASPPLVAQPVNDEVIENSKRGVFHIRTRDEHGKPAGTGTGFVTDADGYAVTNFHVIRGITSATAVFPGYKLEIPLELIAVRPEFDLALLQLKTEEFPERFDLLPLQMRATDLAEGEGVWALGFPLEREFTPAPGVFSAIRDYGELPKPVQTAMVRSNYSAESKWVQTTCITKLGHSGGPVIDAAGRVVGIATWSWAAHQASFAVLASHAAELIDSPPASALTFTKAKEQYPSKAVAGCACCTRPDCCCK